MTSPDPRPPHLLPEDLGPEERDVAGWMSLLPRADAPPAVRAGLFARLDEPRAVPSLRRLALAAAALVLVGFGVATGLRSIAQEEADSAGARFRVVYDPSVSPFHGIDTFDGLASIEAGDESGR
jgi:hypothetical protein